MSKATDVELSRLPCFHILVEVTDDPKELECASNHVKSASVDKAKGLCKIYKCAELSFLKLSKVGDYVDDNVIISIRKNLKPLQCNSSEDLPDDVEEGNTMMGVTIVPDTCFCTR